MDRKQWARFIRQNHSNKLTRAVKTLFEDSDSTIVFLQGLSDTLNLSPRPAMVAELIEEVRESFLGLPPDAAEEFMERAMGSPDTENLFVIVLGNARGESGRSFAALELLVRLVVKQCSVYRNGPQVCSSAASALVVLLNADGKGVTHTWSNAIREMQRRRDTGPLSDMMQYVWCGEMRFSVVPVSRWQEGQAAVGLEQGCVVWRLPCPDDIAGWLSVSLRRSLRKIEEHDRAIATLAAVLRDRAADFRSVYEDMWLETMVEPRWGLREGGLDCVRVAIPGLRESGYRTVTLCPRNQFPDFRASYYRESVNGDPMRIEIDLEPSDLLAVKQGDVPDDSLLVWVDRLLAFVALRAVWTIVMGLDHDGNRSAGHKRAGGGGSAVVRPQFRKLPEGYKASPEARARARAAFRTEPLPGFTFVRQYERGISPQSGDPLFALDRLGLEQ